MVIIMYYLKKKKISRLYCFKVTLVRAGFEPGTFEFPTYSFYVTYLTRPNDLGYSDYLCIPVFLIVRVYNRRFDYKLFLTLFYRM